MVEVRTSSRGWVEVSREQARKWAMSLFSSIMTMNKEDSIKYVDTRLRGTTMADILTDEDKKSLRIFGY